MRERLSLRPYQEGMRAFAAATPMCALWADMGLGKTPTTLAAMQDSLFDRLDVERWLVVGPKLVVADSWPRQLRRWHDYRHMTWRCLTAADFHLAAALDAATGRRTGLKFADRRGTKKRVHAMREDVHLVSWHMLPWLVRACGKNWPYDGIVLDEAIFGANSTSDMHKAAYHVIHRLGAVTRVIELTGAPNPNGYEQLHGQIRLLDAGRRLCNTKTDFRSTFMTPDKVNPHQGLVYSWKLAPGAKAAIDHLVLDVAVSLKTEDYLSLPALNVNPIMVTLPDAARTAYRALERDLMVEVGGREVVAGSEAAKAGKLLQIANGAVYDESGGWSLAHDAKLDQLAELVETVDGPILLAYQYEHDWQRISERFDKLADHVSSPRALDRFRAGKTRMLCMHPGSGAHGLDGLQEVSSHAVWFGATYNADHWLQFNKRLHRDGQRAGRVTVHQLLASDTIEEYVAGRALPDKISAQDALLEAVSFRRHRLAQ